MSSTNPRLVALVPMRHVSERVPGKNYRPLAGRPLYEHILKTLGEVGRISQVVVDTDSPIIADGIGSAFPDVLVINRPEHLRADDLSMNKILLHDAELVEADYYVQTHSTNPLLKAGTITEAIEIFLQRYPEFDSLFSVSPMQSRLWDQAGRPINHDPGELLRTQDLTPVFEENSCLYIFERGSFLERGNRIGAHPLMFETPPQESIDIDDEFAFRLANALLQSSSK